MNEPRTDSTITVRRYAGGSYASALDLYEPDLATLASIDWYPVAQVWGWDAVGSAGWLVSGSQWKPGAEILAVTCRREPRPAPDVRP